MEYRPCEQLLVERIDYRFSDPVLLREALTHKSFSNEQAQPLADNERLEFLGDAVLGLAVGHFLFRHFFRISEGELSRIRAEVVNEPSLAAAARTLGIGECLLLGKGEERSGGRDKDSLIADGFEALLGAIFCDGGFEEARRIIEALLGESLHQAARRKTGLDYKTRLQEHLQARSGRPPEYVLALVEGPDHERMHSVEVRFEGNTIGRGRGRTKKGAEQEAAREALELLGE